ncbi:HEPN domain-containing protein [Echinicola shivajiensis]|uniref:HEPN domain-containing protein n=1 Tax=Echinicola shivajiensis TaxID=1035916 RepID=UPI001BFC845C|nr:HEPN domain-containing protein [Echinicola shivajiensis]
MAARKSLIQSKEFSQKDLISIQESAKARALLWIERIPFEEENWPPCLLVALSNGSTLPRKRARQNILSTGLYPIDKADLAFCHIDELKAGLRRGGLFHLLYLSHQGIAIPNISLPFQPVSKSLLERRYEESYQQFKVSSQKALAFRNGALHFWNKKDFTTAAFMFHQAIELGFHASEQFALGKAKQSHKLLAHILSAEFYAPSLASIFLDNQHELISALQILEKSYLGARYRSNFLVTEEELNGLSELVGDFYRKLFKLPDYYKTAMIHSIQKSEISTNLKVKSMKPRLEDRIALIRDGLNDHVRTFLEELVVKFDISHVLCFGIQTREGQGFSPFMFSSSSAESRYDLLIISKTKDVSAIQEFCFQEEIKGIGIFAIAYHKKEVGDLLNKQSRFFYTILQSGHLFYGCPKDLGFKMAPPNYQDIRRGITNHWRTRCRRASHYLETAGRSKNESPEVALFLIHLGLEQLALGIVYCYMGYTPKFRSLSFLFALCGNFTSVFAELFQNEELQGRELLKSLCASFSGARFKSSFKVDKGQVTTLLSHIPKLTEELNLLQKEKIQELHSKIGEL